jgi:hypothetical protein
MNRACQVDLLQKYFKGFCMGLFDNKNKPLKRAGLGAVIGTMIAGPLGTVIGGAIGGMVGLNEETYDEKFKSYKDKHQGKSSAELRTMSNRLNSPYATENMKMEMRAVRALLREKG